MLKVPTVSDLDAMCGVWKGFVPKWTDVPQEYHDFHSNEACKLVSDAFFNGAQKSGHGLTIGSVNLKPKEGVNGLEAMKALFACLRSFEPKHEIKISTCGYMLDQWFEETK